MPVPGLEQALAVRAKKSDFPDDFTPHTLLFGHLREKLFDPRGALMIYFTSESSVSKAVRFLHWPSLDICITGTVLTRGSGRLEVLLVWFPFLLFIHLADLGCVPFLPTALQVPRSPGRAESP